ncbi:hypothetical protein [uncultured Roseibium sp.]|uniref:hypothetical protein n=1 Tax=uncultured Roseibium sp. TaxID=1936171 RepID=UPI0026180833|nr:hypothetical protein [uncultured Roseibium sp.]
MLELERLAASIVNVPDARTNPAPSAAQELLAVEGELPGNRKRPVAAIRTVERKASFRPERIGIFMRTAPSADLRNAAPSAEKDSHPPVS